MPLSTQRAVAGILVKHNLHLVAKPPLSEACGPLATGGEWVFPGCALTTNEDPRQALARALKTKLNLDAVVGRSAGVFHCDTANGPLELACFWVDSFEGEPTLNGYAACAWLSHAALQGATLAPEHGVVWRGVLARYAISSM